MVNNKVYSNCIYESIKILCLSRYFLNYYNRLNKAVTSALLMMCHPILYRKVLFTSFGLLHRSGLLRNASCTEKSICDWLPVNCPLLGLSGKI